jgi:hypothetical protein
MTILTDAEAINRFPGNDGLVGTADDVVSSQRTATSGSESNLTGSYGLNAFNFGGAATDPELPEGFNAITFVNGTVTVDQGVMTNGGGAVISALEISSGTEPFVGHGAYTASATAINSGSYDPTSGDFTLDLDIAFLINGNTATEPGLVLTGSAFFVPANDFGSSTGNAYVDGVLAPMAQASGADSLAYFDGTGTLPNLGFPIRFVIVAVEGGSGGFAINQGIAGSWFNPDTAGQGFLIDVNPSSNFIFIAWFTYDDGSAKIGAPEHRWLTAQGDYSGGSASLPLFVTSGGAFDSPQGTATVQDGTLNISFSDCNSGSVQYQLDGDGLSGSIAIQRLLPATADLCETLGTPLNVE